jgi:hypothetical protein
MRFITTLITAMATVICMVCGTMLDSENPVPMIVCGLCLVWMLLWLFVRRNFK